MQSRRILMKCDSDRATPKVHTKTSTNKPFPKRVRQLKMKKQRSTSTIKDAKH